MSQLGSGQGSGFPHAIDTRQTFINSPMAAPDSASRADAELFNDSLHAIVQVETILGANPNGDFASVAARLQQFLPGGGESPLHFSFTVSTSVTIAGTTHSLGTASPLIQVYNDSAPRQALEPNTVVVNTTSYDVVVTFATPQSGIICLANPVPQYTTPFSAVTSVSVPGSTHLLGTDLLFVSIYTLVDDTAMVRSPSAVSIDPASYDVVVTFATPASGELCLSAAGPRYDTSFTNQTSVAVLGGTHGLATSSLLYQCYDAANPRHLLEPNTFSVDPATFDVLVTFATPQSGVLLLVAATGISGTEFQIRDRGVTNSSAVRVFSQAGTLQLQMGSGELLQVQNATGGVVQETTNDGDFLVTGTATKPGGGSWLSPSDVRLKKDIRPFTDGLDLLVQFEPVWFRYNGLGGIRPDGREHVSLVAQAVQALAPYLVGSRPGVLEPGGPGTEVLTFDAQPLVYLLLNAVKTLRQTIAGHETRLARLEAALLPPEEVSP